MQDSLLTRDVDLLEEVIADRAFEESDSPTKLFRFWLGRAQVPKQWIQNFGQWPSNLRIASRSLITSLHNLGINPNDGNNTLGSFLYFLIINSELGLDKASLMAAIIVRYGLIRDEQLLKDLVFNYQIPVKLDEGTAPKSYGPEIDWQGPSEELQLQGLFTAEPDFLDVGFLMSAIQQAVSVCRIEALNGRALGTGFLLKKNLLLTNYHVLQEHDSPLEDLISSAHNILLRFGYFTAKGGGTTDGQTFRLDQDNPIVECSPTNKLDYALLRVENKISKASKVREAECDFESSLSEGMDLTILQHPEGETMKLAASKDGIARILPNGLVQYANKAAGGSSGSPCFNEDWKVVALHHAERSRPVGAIREGILLSSIYPEIKQHLG